MKSKQEQSNNSDSNSIIYPNKSEMSLNMNTNNHEDHTFSDFSYNRSDLQHIDVKSNYTSNIKENIDSYIKANDTEDRILQMPGFNNTIKNAKKSSSSNINEKTKDNKNLNFPFQKNMLNKKNYLKSYITKPIDTSDKINNSNSVSNQIEEEINNVPQQNIPSYKFSNKSGVSGNNNTNIYDKTNNRGGQIVEDLTNSNNIVKNLVKKPSIMEPFEIEETNQTQISQTSKEIIDTVESNKIQDANFPKHIEFVNSNIVKYDESKNNDQNEEISSSLNKDEKEPIYVMTVELDQNNYKNLKIYSDSVPEELAFEFCKENALDVSSLHYLTEEISNLLITSNLNYKKIEAIEEVEEENNQDISKSKNSENEESSYKKNEINDSKASVKRIVKEKKSKSKEFIAYNPYEKIDNNFTLEEEIINNSNKKAQASKDVITNVLINNDHNLSSHHSEKEKSQVSASNTSLKESKSKHSFNSKKMNKTQISKSEVSNKSNNKNNNSIQSKNTHSDIEKKVQNRGSSMGTMKVNPSKNDTGELLDTINNSKNIIKNKSESKIIANSMNRRNEAIKNITSNEEIQKEKNYCVVSSPINSSKSKIFNNTYTQGFYNNKNNTRKAPDSQKFNNIFTYNEKNKSAYKEVDKDNHLLVNKIVSEKTKEIIRQRNKEYRNLQSPRLPSNEQRNLTDTNKEKDSNSSYTIFDRLYFNGKQRLETQKIKQEELFKTQKMLDCGTKPFAENIYPKFFNNTSRQEFYNRSKTNENLKCKTSNYNSNNNSRCNSKSPTSYTRAYSRPILNGKDTNFRETEDLDDVDFYIKEPSNPETYYYNNYLKTINGIPNRELEFAMNKGERLYWSGINFLYDKDKKLKKERESLSKKKLLNNKKPELNTTTNILMLKGRVESCNSYEYLSNYHDKKKDRINKIKESLPTEPVYLFKPKINSK